MSLEQPMGDDMHRHETPASALTEEGLSTGLGDEGGFAPDVAGTHAALELISTAIDATGLKLGSDVGKLRLATQGEKSGETVVVSPPAELKQGSTIASKE